MAQHGAKRRRRMQLNQIGSGHELARGQYEPARVPACHHSLTRDTALLRRGPLPRPQMLPAMLSGAGYSQRGSPSTVAGFEPPGAVPPMKTPHVASVPGCVAVAVHDIGSTATSTIVTPGEGA